MASAASILDRHRSTPRTSHCVLQGSWPCWIDLRRPRHCQRGVGGFPQCHRRRAPRRRRSDAAASIANLIRCSWLRDIPTYPKAQPARGAGFPDCQRRAFHSGRCESRLTSHSAVLDRSPSPYTASGVGVTSMALAPRAKRKGTKFGRPSSLDASQRRKIAERYAAGETMAELAIEYKCGEASVPCALSRPSQARPAGEGGATAAAVSVGSRLGHFRDLDGTPTAGGPAAPST